MRSASSIRHARFGATRGASLIEYILLVGAAVLACVGAFTVFGGDVGTATRREGECVGSLAAGCGGSTVDVSAEAATAGASSSGAPAPGSSGGLVPGGLTTPEASRALRDQAQAAFTELDNPANPPTAERARQLEAFIEAAAAQLAAAEMDAWRSGDGELGLALAEDAMTTKNIASRARERAFQVVAAERREGGVVWEFGKGVVVDGAWGTVTGLWTAVTNPIDTATGVWTAVTNPIDTYNAISTHVATQWEENPSRFLGAAVFEVATLVVAPAKVGKVATVAEHAGDAVVATVRSGADDAAVVVARADDVPSCPGGICMAPGQCFAAGTPVRTADGGLKAIEEIAAGDEVLARDPVTGETLIRRVVGTKVTPDREVTALTLEVTGATETLTVTDEHPFWVDGRGFLPVRDLAPGDVVHTATGLARVASLASLDARVTVYNFEVEGAHTYFVGELGAWVHNACAPRVGESVLVPRTDGSLSGGQVISDLGDGRLVVEVPAAGGTGTKIVNASDLVRRRTLGEEVLVPRSDGTRTPAMVTELHTDGTVTVIWDEGGRFAEKTVHESALFDLPGETTRVPLVPTPPGGFAVAGRYQTVPMDSRYAGEQLPGNHVWGSTVAYLDDAGRAAHRLEVRDGLIYDANGQLFDTSNAVVARGRGAAIFVMDADGVIYASNHQAVGQFHHSSLAGGQPVAAAGEIQVQQGRLMMVTDQSGHYMPGRAYTEQVLSELESRGVATTWLPVRYAAPE